MCNTGKINRGGDLEHIKNTDSSQQFKIHVNGLYVITCSLYLYVGKRMHLLINGNIVATAPYVNSGGSVTSSITYVSILKENDIVEIFNNDNRLLKDDSNISVFRIS